MPAPVALLSAPPVAAAAPLTDAPDTPGLALFIEKAGAWIEAAGVAVIVLGVLVTSALYLCNLRREGGAAAYPAYRKGLARSILLGLELLVAGDIIRTVVVAPTLTNVATLAAIVLIRTFLSFTLELEITGRWPWSRQQETARRETREV